MNFEKCLFLAALLLITLLVSMNPVSLANSEEKMGPILDDYYMIVIADPYAQVDAWKAGEIDIVSPPEYGMLQELEAPPYEGKYRSFASTYFDYYDFNINSEYPMNDVHFRRATASLTNTANLIAIDPWFRGWCSRDLGSWLPKQNGGWYNPDCPEYPYDWDYALEEMAAGGFTYVLKEGYTEPVPRGIDHWNDPEGNPLRSFEMSTCTDWLYYTHMADAWLTELLDFGLGVSQDYQGWTPYVQKVWAGNFDFHVMGTSWWIGDPLILDLYFRSTNVWPNCCNWRRWNDTEADTWLDIILTTLNVTEAVDACHKLVYKVADQCIMVPALTWTNSFIVNKDLIGFRKSPATVDLNFAYLQEHWATAEAREAHDNAIRVSISGDPGGTEMNPYTQAGVLESSILGMICDSYGLSLGLTFENPITAKIEPWIAYDWKIEKTEYGEKLTYYLRDDVYWHDGVQFTAEDVKFSLESMKEYQSQAATACQYLWKVEVKDIGSSVTDPTLDGWPEAIVYENSSSLFLNKYVSMWATIAAKHIWEPIITGGTDPREVPAWNEPNPINPELSLLVGTGPWMFYRGDWVPGEYLRLRANRNYFKSGEKSLADVNLDSKIDIKDIATAAKAFGSYPGHERWQYRADINYDDKVDIRDIATIAKDFGKTW